MTSFKFLAAATILSALIASSASAHVIDEPGMYAFYHPNGDLGIASSRPPADAQAMAPRLMMRHPLLPARQVRSVK